MPASLACQLRPGLWASSIMSDGRGPKWGSAATGAGVDVVNTPCGGEGRVKVVLIEARLQWLGSLNKYKNKYGLLYSKHISLILECLLTAVTMGWPTPSVGVFCRLLYCSPHPPSNDGACICEVWSNVVLSCQAGIVAYVCCLFGSWVIMWPFAKLQTWSAAN